MPTTRTQRADRIDAALALAGAAAHLVAVWLVGRWPPSLGFAGSFETVPVVLAVVAAVVLVVRSDRRPLVVACFWTWAAVAFTLPAYFLGLAFVPGAVLLSLPFRSPPD
jgi:hypothetical protein